MLRSGFLLGVGGAAAMLTMIALPSVRASADRLVVKPVSMNLPALQASSELPGMRPASIRISPVHGQDRQLVTMQRPEAKAPAAIGPSASEKDLIKPRRLTREGCEAPLSSLVGPEARRMVPGRCMT